MTDNADRGRRSYLVTRTAPGSIVWRLRIYEPCGVVQACPERMIWARTIGDAMRVAERVIAEMPK